MGSVFPAFFQFFLVLFDLLFQFCEDLVEGAEKVAGLITGNEHACFFRVDGNFECWFFGFCKVDDGINGGQSVEESFNFIKFLNNSFLCGIIYFAVPGGNIDLHYREFGEKPTWTELREFPNTTFFSFYQKRAAKQEGGFCMQGNCKFRNR